MAKKKSHQTFEYEENDIEKAVDHIARTDLPGSVKSLITNCLQTCLSINSLLQKNRSLRRLIGRLFGFKSEKGKKKSPKEGESSEKTGDNSGERKGHGRRGYQDLEGATHTYHSHPELKKGAPCPEDDCEGKVYPLKNPGVYVRVTANEPIQTTVHLTEKFRCNLCGETFEYVPTDVKEREKYDEKILAHVLMHKCFYGVAFGRDAAYGSLSASVRSDLFKEADNLLKGVYGIVAKTLICSDVVSFDDTKIKIQPQEKGGSKSAWASCFISRDAAIFIFDRFHAGICLEELLKERPDYLEKMVALSDALPSYQSYKKDCIDAHCLTHARRRFVNSKEEDQEYCETIIDLIGEIYDTDVEGKKLGDVERMDLHQLKSKEILGQLMEEVQESIESTRFLPNSDLGRAVNYIAEEFNKLNVFMRVPGVPLDTNHVERKIKSPIRLRKQAPIYKTEEGARRTGRMLSLIETCLLTEVDPSKYLSWAIKGARKKIPDIELTPWVFKRHLEKEQWRPPPNFGKEDSLIEMLESDGQMATS